MKVKQLIYNEYPGNNDFVKNVVLNATAEILQDDKQISFLPSGSWVTGKGYDAALSDHDLTILVPNSSYPKMEKRIVDVKEELKELVVARLKSHKVQENKIYTGILPSINIFPTPKIQNCFDSYSQYREYTNLKINLNSAQEDADKGLWQMKGMMTKHFEEEGNLVYLQDGKVKNIRIKNNKDKFYRYLNKNKVDMPNAEPFFFTQKIKILNEFIEILKTNKDISPREFFKYLQRVQKFFFRDANNDLFLFTKDTEKSNNIKYQKLIAQEKRFESKYNEIIEGFKESKNTGSADRYWSKTLENLKLFQEFSLELLKRPILRGFKK